MKKLTPKEQFDKNLERHQAEEREVYQDKDFMRRAKQFILVLLVFNFAMWILSILYYETTFLQRISMLAIIIFQLLFWICAHKEKCFYYFDKAIANYYYHVLLWILYGISEMLFEAIFPIFS